MVTHVLYIYLYLSSKINHRNLLEILFYSSFFQDTKKTNQNKMKVIKKIVNTKTKNQETLKVNQVPVFI